MGRTRGMQMVPAELVARRHSALGRAVAERIAAGTVDRRQWLAVSSGMIGGPRSKLGQTLAVHGSSDYVVGARAGAYWRDGYQWAVIISMREEVSVC